MIDASDTINQRYLIPHHSTAKFGLIYCPGVKTENHTFERVSDIIQAQDLPKVVACTKKYKGKNEGCSLGVNEVLIVMEVRRDFKCLLHFSSRDKVIYWSIGPGLYSILQALL